MLNKQSYTAYLASKKSSDKLTKERLGLLDRFNEVIVQNGITEISGIGEAEIIEHMRPWNRSGRRNFLHNISAFFADYAKFIDKECPELSSLATVIRAFYLNEYIQGAKNVVGKFKDGFIPIPAGYKVNPTLLGELTSEQFVKAFAQLREFVTDCYDDIDKAPLEWGYPDFDATEGYYNRVMDILFAFGWHGTYQNGVMTVDTKQFFALNNVKRHKKIELMASGFKRMGLLLENFNKKSESFTVTYPANPHVLYVLSVYARQMNANTDKWQWQPHRNSLCYRYIQDPATQKYPAMFNAEMDYNSDKLREIQEWLYAEAEKCGFTFDTSGLPKGCINYKKGSKDFLRVRQGQRPPNTNHFDHHDAKICTKVSFIHAFEREPDKMRELVNRFPQVFRLDDPGVCCDDKNPDTSLHTFANNSEKDGKRCAFRMKFTFDGVTYKRCGLAHFFFEDISFDDVKIILEMFKIENKIK